MGGRESSIRIYYISGKKTSSDHTNSTCTWYSGTGSATIAGRLRVSAPNEVHSPASNFLKNCISICMATWACVSITSRIDNLVQGKTYRLHSLVLFDPLNFSCTSACLFALTEAPTPGTDPRMSLTQQRCSVQQPFVGDVCCVQ